MAMKCFFITVLATITMNSIEAAEVLWERKYGIGIADSSILVGEIIEGGEEELVFATTTGRVIVCDFAGEIHWSVPTHEVFANPPTLADLFPGDGLEVLTQSKEGTLRAFSSKGEEMWVYSLPSGLEWNRTTLVASDLDGDGQVEVLGGDREGNFVCLNRLGELLWNVEVPGGFSCPPAVADLDGDGMQEIILTSGSEELIALRSDGEIFWRTELGCINHSGPVVADLRSDGEIDILVGGEDGLLKCFSSQGESEWNLRVGNKEIDSTLAVGNLVEGGNLEIVCIDLEGNLVCANAHGRELWGSKLPNRSRRAPSIADFNGDGEMELLASGYFSTFYLFSSEGETIEETPGFSTNGGATLIQVEDRLAAVIPGDDGRIQCLTWQKESEGGVGEIEWGLYRANANQTGSRIPPTQATPAPSADNRDLEKVTTQLKVLLPDLYEGLDRIRLRRLSLKKKEASLPNLGSLELELIEANESLQSILSDAQNNDLVSILILNRRIEGLLDEIQQSINQADSVLAALKEKGSSPFLVWPTNPWWQIRKINEETPEFLSAKRIELEMYRNETESAALNLMNVSMDPITIQVRIEPADRIKSNPEPTVFEVVSVPTEVEDFSDDALVELNKGNLIRLSPGETRQLFMNFAAIDSTAGVYSFEVSLAPIQALAKPETFPITMEVHDIDIQEGTPPYLCTWGYRHSSPLNEYPEETWQDRIGHGNNVLLATSNFIPRGVFDASGGLTDSLDWGDLEKFIDSRPGLEMILFLVGEVVRPATEGLDGEAKERAMKSWVEEWVAFLSSKGFGYDRFGYYPVDEPGLNPGLVELFIDYAKQMREADPQVLIYTDPVERADLDDIKKMAPYVDIWCPNRNGFLLEDDDPRMEVMKSEGKLLWTYECLHHAKHRPPLHYYRGLAWLSALRGCSGFGFWSYCTSADDPWFYPEKRLHDYLLVYPGKGVVTSRRWESVRDGVEDLRALSLLQERTKRSPNDEVKRVIEDALEELGEIGTRPDGTGDYTQQGLGWMTPLRVDAEYDAYQKHRKRIAELTLRD